MATLGRIAARAPLRAAIADYGFPELPITVEHADAVGELPPRHRDPFDRLLIAQALREGLVILTLDPAFRGYGVPTA